MIIAVKRTLFLVGDFVEGYEAMVPFRVLDAVAY